MTARKSVTVWLRDSVGEEECSDDIMITKAVIIAALSLDQGDIFDTNCGLFPLCLVLSGWLLYHFITIDLTLSF